MTYTTPIEKIGVFDSGLGGLTVLKELLRAQPMRSYVYFGDTAHVPYGSRTAHDVIGLVTEISRHLVVSEGCQALVVACNTSSALALSALRAAVDVPVLGVIEPGSVEAARVTKVGKIGVLATPLTARSGVYGERIRDAARRSGAREPEVVELGCPELVPIVEEGDLESPESRRVLQGYVDLLRQHGVDTVIMGCTHYPLLLPVLLPMLGEGIQVVDPASLIPRTLAEWPLPQGDSRGSVAFQVSGVPASFDQRAARFLGQEVGSRQVVLGLKQRATT